MFGLGALDKISASEYKRWEKYFDVFGPVWWKRDDWNFANVIDSVVGSRNTSPKTFLLKFKRESTDQRNQSVLIVSAFGGLPPEDISEIREAAELY
ncbi:MAG: hypothetical protein LBQ54_02260 [Planctomycetaceae bacterium]|nr:hypothetical protein [Planctomycetaceae bacterium]